MPTHSRHQSSERAFGLGGAVEEMLVSVPKGWIYRPQPPQLSKRHGKEDLLAPSIVGFCAFGIIMEGV